MKNSKEEIPLRVAFIHPDLGIGGAEQLMVNLALTCQKLGWYVKMYTPSYNKERAFSQTKDGTIPVEIHGTYFPRLIFGKFHALCESIRMTLCALWVIFFGEKFDLVILDQIPLPVPLLSIKYKTLFYCHHPDKVLCVERKSIFKKIYRFFIDLLEELTMLFSHTIVVNSIYTREIYLKSFNILGKFRALPNVIYPSIDLYSYDRNIETKKGDLLQIKGLKTLSDKKIDIKKMKVIVSLNRYERKKNLDLAVLSYMDYVLNYSKKPEESCLIIAGGYDTFLQENIDVFNKLVSYIDNEEKKKLNIFFLKNIDNNERSILFRTANIVLYTPKFEHFGIVPLEAMYCGAWVLASKTGGPMESVVDGKTGNLLDNEEPIKWSNKINEMFSNNDNFNSSDSMNSSFLRQTLKSHVEDNFSLKRMYNDLFNEVKNLFPNKKLKKD